VIDVLASAPHYADHLAAVFGALPDGTRGSFMASNAETAERIRSLGYEPSDLRGSAHPVLAASYADMVRASTLSPALALMEHGAGQSYGGRGVNHGSYAGGRNRDAVSLFLHPGTHPAARDRSAYPRARVEVVGSPHLDTLPKREGPPGRVVAFTFHFNGPLCPETRSAYPDFFPAIAGLSKRFELLGHGHPMLWDRGRGGRQLADRYRENGIEPVKDFSEVCRRADVLVFDNTSVGFAFAATGRPVVVMNSPRYDRRVNHGLRFWDAAGVGVNCDDPAKLGACIEEALADSPERKAAREAGLDLVYAYRSGAAKRAADALLDWAGIRVEAAA
jgi:glycosyltransferase involved in cell wall biosynthesis